MVDEMLRSANLLALITGVLSILASAIIAEPQVFEVSGVIHGKSPCKSEWSKRMAESSELGGNAPARDGNIAIQEEYDLAIEADTQEALQLFILRHPDHPLAALAKEILQNKNK